MRALGIAGVVRGKARRTTIPDPATVRAPDIVQRRFTATRPNELWVSDFTYVATWSGMLYVAFVIDVYSRLILGWRGSEHAHRAGPGRAGDGRLAARQRPGRAGLPLGYGQYTSIRYTTRLAEIGAAPSVGTVGGCYHTQSRIMPVRVGSPV
jgi:putative transposase